MALLCAVLRNPHDAGRTHRWVRGSRLFRSSRFFDGLESCFGKLRVKVDLLDMKSDMINKKTENINLLTNKTRTTTETKYRKNKHMTNNDISFSGP